MSFLDIDLSDAQPLTLLESDTECEVQIVSADIGNSKKNNNPYLRVRFIATEYPTSKDITVFYTLPNASMDARALNNCKNRLVSFFSAFGVDDPGGMEIEELVGLSAWAIVGVRENNQSGEEENYIKKFTNG